MPYIDPDRLSALASALRPAMQQAGRLIEDHRARGIEARLKTGDASYPESPVTDADEEAELLLTSAIRQMDPAAIIVGEEATAAGRQPDPAPLFWLIDPLDGTRDYVNGGADYSVNIGLIHHGNPVLGLVLHPPTGVLWGGIVGQYAWKEQPGSPVEQIRSRPRGAQPIALTSRSHLDPRTTSWLDGIGPHAREATGSSLKFCRLAEGSADFYPRFGPTHEWDTAAADAVLRAAGGQTLHSNVGNQQTPFAYGKTEYLNGPFLALGDPEAARHLPNFNA